MNSPVVTKVTVKNQFFPADYAIDVLVTSPEASKSLSTIEN